MRQSLRKAISPPNRLSQRMAVGTAAIALAVAATPPAIASDSEPFRLPHPTPAHQVLPAGGLPQSDSHPAAGASILLKGVKAISPDDVWAVGYKIVGSVWSPVVRHWDGQTWKAVRVPIPAGATFAILEGVSATSSDDVWVAGTTSEGVPPALTWVDHFDGKHWSIVPTQDVAGSSQSSLATISAAAPDDVWANGFYSSSTGYVTLTEHWDGKKWTIVNSPNQSPYWDPSRDDLSLPNGEAWSVGEALNDDGVSYAAFAQHFTGRVWKVTRLDLPIGVWSQLFGVAGIASDDIWAVGCTSTGGFIGCPYGTDDQSRLVERWNGKKWTSVETPKPKGAVGTAFSDVYVAAADDVWVVGNYTKDGTERPFTEHWDGSAWSIVSVPMGRQTASQPWAVSGTGPSDIWLVGDGAPKPQIAAHWDGTK